MAATCPGSDIAHDGSLATADKQSPIGQAHAISGSAGGNEGYFPDVPAETLTKTGSYSQASLSSSAGQRHPRGADYHRRQSHRPG